MMRFKTRVSLAVMSFNQSIELIGVYTWKSGVKANVTLHQGLMIFEQPLIYPQKDYRMEYVGDVKDEYIPHGEGTLTLKNGMVFTDNWVDGICCNHS